MPWSPDDITIGEFEDLPVQELPRRNGWFSPEPLPAVLPIAQPTPTPEPTVAPIAIDDSIPIIEPPIADDDDYTLDWSRLAQISRPIPAATLEVFPHLAELHPTSTIDAPHPLGLSPAGTSFPEPTTSASGDLAYPIVCSHQSPASTTAEPALSTQHLALGSLGIIFGIIDPAFSPANGIILPNRATDPALVFTQH